MINHLHFKYLSNCSIYTSLDHLQELVAEDDLKKLDQNLFTPKNIYRKQNNLKCIKMAYNF